MNVPDINRSILRMHIAAIEGKHPIKILGLLPRGSAAHVLEGRNATTVFYVLGDRLWAFGLSRAGMPLCR